MGRKAKKRKERKQPDRDGVTKLLEPNEFDGQMNAYMRDPDWRLVFADKGMAVWVFTNDATGQIATIGEQESCMKLKAAYQRVIREYWEENMSFIGNN